jgi:DNA uptake protein ComE-like DNA-binding protein
MANRPMRGSAVHNPPAENRSGFLNSNVLGGNSMFHDGRGLRIVRTMVLIATLTGGLTTSTTAQVGKPSDPPLLDPNLAKSEELQKVPHFTPELARALIENRPYLRTADFDKFLVEQKLTPEQRGAVYRRIFLHVNLNKATKDEMKLIPGLGERMIHEFEEYRPYKALSQFRREIGKYVDANELARLEQYVFVPVHLNTASDEDILSIPGMGAKMLHEFEEYRPYRSIEQFRREIGKYVNETELARLESYVTIGEPAGKSKESQ